MKIGIDISQIAHEKTGVAIYIQKLVEYLIAHDKENQYILFYSSLRKNFQFSIHQLAEKVQSNPKNVKIKTYRIPPTLLDILWNRLHIMPIEWFIGDIDIFISSDWIQPPTKRAKKATILYDLIVYKYPEETAKKIISVQKRRLRWVKKECDVIFCISESTKKDAREILHIEEKRLKVIYPGV